ncbi:hypothetical protein [Bacillus wiedmannii]|uniref:hypothetical protein n=1 Tax=Bacillus wiedmannii TaxID=1890302 RepID=UPI0021CE9B19|nr:hypothetical protein [Bacillus wiedmannii]MCU5096129.1 hypothetical protein [Bacillus wiedmannii]
MDETLYREKQIYTLHKYISKESDPLFQEMNIEQIEHFYSFYKPTIYIKRSGEREFEAYCKEFERFTNIDITSDKTEREFEALVSLISQLHGATLAAIMLIKQGYEIPRKNLHYLMHLFLYSHDGKSSETALTLRHTNNIYIQNNQGEFEPYDLRDSIDFSLYADFVTNQKIDQAVELFQNKEQQYTLEDVQRKTNLPMHIIEGVHGELQERHNQSKQK